MIGPHQRQNCQLNPYRFEVLGQVSGVVPAGAVLRIAPKFLYRLVSRMLGGIRCADYRFSSLALISTGVDYEDFHSTETHAAFIQYDDEWSSAEDTDTSNSDVD